MDVAWKSFATRLIANQFAPVPANGEIYERSLLLTPENAIFLARANTGKRLIMLERTKNKLFDELKAEEIGNIGEISFKSAELSHANAEVMRRYVSFMKPVAFGRTAVSVVESIRAS